MRVIICLLVLTVINSSCKDSTELVEIPAHSLMRMLQKGLMETVSEDLFTPPVASRIYAYTHLSAYEALRPYHPGYKSFTSYVSGLEIVETELISGMAQAALLEAFTRMSQHLVYRDHMIQDLKESIVRHFELDTLSDAYIEGRKTGLLIVEQILRRANQDGYLQSRTLPKYTTGTKPSSWQATAPTFGEALEPHWYKLMPFFVDSSNQFRSKLPIEFDTKTGSPFYEEAEEVLGYVARANEDSVAVAVYWDCNPGPTMLDGHFMQVRKQNTPAGHWLGIVAQMCEMQHLNLIESTQLFATVSMSIADGFICAWDTKYAFDLLRPETYINQYIDSDWRPKLESPLFPEYSSAHSIISAIAASVLTHKLGDSIAFTDSTNTSFGLPPRSFDSFWDAANEAAVSRLLGGIHYPFGCRDGISQGKEIGAYIIRKLE